ncbi:MAG: PQQ-binding-like beta-propeller repeat protein [Methylovulum miyakonense]|uniref:outer membrane protein assembly factor BamB family protein n=1 Tax=Methylovulum miyakonense TaxID=645578 RepID=UPI003BB61D58
MNMLNPAPKFFLNTVLLLLACTALGVQAANVALSPVAGPPTTNLKVNGSGFPPSTLVDIFFDMDDRCLTLSNANGTFSCSFKVSKASEPGQYWITAISRSGITAAQRQFTVRTNWTDFRGGQRNQGYNPYENVINKNNVEQLTERWQFTAGNAVASSPAVVNGVVYVGSYDGNVYAINAATGVQKWAYPTGGIVGSSPAVANGVVYIGSNEGKSLFALNAATGVKKWAFPTGSHFVSSSPTVANGVVYVGTLDVNSSDGKVYAINATTGVQKWVYPMGAWVYSSPTVVNGLVYVGAYDGKLHALNAVTGVQKWASPTGNLIGSSPAVVNGVVYVGSTDHVPGTASNVYAFDAATGVQKWSFPTGDRIFSSPAVAKGVVYIASDDGKIYALDAATGAQKWVFPTSSDRFASPPTVANDLVYIGSYYEPGPSYHLNKIYALDAATGAQKAAFPTGAETYGNPVVADGVLYFGTGDGLVRAYDLEPGNISTASKANIRPDPRRLTPDYKLPLSGH